MSPQEAVSIILQEGTGDEGLVVGVRMGTIPNSERMARLLAALETVFHDLHGRQAIDRRLALALFALSFHIQGDVDGMLGRQQAIREEFVGDEMVRMFLLIESIFEDEWLLD